MRVRVTGVVGSDGNSDLDKGPSLLGKTCILREVIVVIVCAFGCGLKHTMV